MVATPVDGATFTSDGAEMDGTNDYISITPWEMGGTKHTFEMAFTPSSIVDNNNDSNMIFDFGDDGHYNNVQFFNGNGYPSRTIFNINNGVTNQYRHNQIYHHNGNANTVENSTHCHIVITVEGSKVTTYKNGSYLTQTTTSYGPDNDAASGTNSMPLLTRAYHYIGKAIEHGDKDGDGQDDIQSGNRTYYTFGGTFHFMRIWNGVSLSAKEISTLYSKRFSVNPISSLNNNNFNTFSPVTRTVSPTELILDLSLIHI